MPYVSTKTFSTTRYTSGGASESGPHGVANFFSSSNRYKTPRSANNAKSSQNFGAHAKEAVSAGRGGSSCESHIFDKLQQELTSSGRLFEDPDFPATDSSIYFSQRVPSCIKWKRPHEIVNDPKFILEGASRFDVCQGELGDCWLLAAIASLSIHKKLFDQVVDNSQTFQKPKYCGMFKFKFWRFGEWKEVFVDDRLPTRNGSLVFMQSKDKNEFWSALFEKAYAKLCASYESLKGGSTTEALEDFTGGISEMFDLRSPKLPGNLFTIMSKAHARCSLMGCSIDADPNVHEAQLANGLIMGHAYSITGVKLVTFNLPGSTGKIPLLRIRNPWGNEAEWNGAFSDKSQEWKYLSDQERNNLGLTFDADGEFWMSYPDFVKHFQKLEICHLGPQSHSDEDSEGRTRWEMCVEQSEWKRRVSAGGCRNYIETFGMNPQFKINIVDADDDDDADEGTIIVGLMQKDMRKKRLEGAELLTIGYCIYKVDSHDCGLLDKKFFQYHQSAGKSPTFINMREVCGRHKLKPGTYVILPSTFEPNEEASFILRIFSEKPNETGELDEATGMDDSEAQAPVATEDPQINALRSMFQKTSGEDGEIDAYELRDILNAAFQRDFKFDGFSTETTRSMVAMMDYDQSGKLGFDEFSTLWKDLRHWKTAFKKYDRDQSGTLSSYELRDALHAIAFRVSNKILNSLVMRFATRDGHIEFDDFILCCVRLKTVFETFKSQSKNSSGQACFDIDTFIQCVMYV